MKETEEYWPEIFDSNSVCSIQKDSVSEASSVEYTFNNYDDFAAYMDKRVQYPILKCAEEDLNDFNNEVAFNHHSEHLASSAVDILSLNDQEDPEEHQELFKCIFEPLDRAISNPEEFYADEFLDCLRTDHAFSFNFKSPDSLNVENLPSSLCDSGTVDDFKTSCSNYIPVELSGPNYGNIFTYWFYF